jgi:hypothetical protein
MGWEEGGDTLETRGDNVSEVPPARTTTWKSISRENCGGGGRRRRGFWCSSDYGGGEGLQSNEFLNMDPTADRMLGRRARTRLPIWFHKAGWSIGLLVHVCL